MKCRVFKKPDGRVIYSWPAKKYQGGYFVNDATKPIYEEQEILVGHENDEARTPIYEKKTVHIGYEQRELQFDEAKHDPITEGLPFVDIEQEDLPNEAGRDWYAHGPLFIDGAPTKENLKFDEGWDNYLMPPNVIKRKQVARLSQELDTLLEDSNSDTRAVAIKQRELDKVKEKKLVVVQNGTEYPDPDWYQVALTNLDARVTKGEADKPVIRQKLIDKISGATPDMQPVIGVIP